MRILTLAAFVAALAACPFAGGLFEHRGMAMAEEARITGTAGYRERIALDPAARLHVQLEDTSLADAPAVIIASMVFATDGRVPVAFSLPYQAAVIDERHSYTVRAELVLGREVIFRTVQAYPVITRDAPQEVELELVAAHPRPAGRNAGDPVGRWLVEDLDGRGVMDYLQTTITIEHGGRIYGDTGCNRFSGEAEVAGDMLSFPPMAVTGRICAPAVNDQEARFLDVLDRTTGFRREGPFLFLLDEKRTEIARLIDADG